MPYLGGVRGQCQLHCDSNTVLYLAWLENEDVPLESHAIGTYYCGRGGEGGALFLPRHTRRQNHPSNNGNLVEGSTWNKTVHETDLSKSRTRVQKIELAQRSVPELVVANKRVTTEHLLKIADQHGTVDPKHTVIVPTGHRSKMPINT